MRRTAFSLLTLVLCASAGVLSAAVLAAGPTRVFDTITGGTTTSTTPTDTTGTTTTTTPTTPTPRPQSIPAGVTIGGLLVGGLSATAAQAEVRVYFARPLTLLVGKRKLKVTPQELGAAAELLTAVDRARSSRPGVNIPLTVRAPQAKIERYVRQLAARLDRVPVDSRLFLRKGKPFVTKSVDGRSLRQVLVGRALFNAVKTHDRAPVKLPFQAVVPAVTPRSIGDVIVIRRGKNRLELYDGAKLRRTFGVATGQARYPTPLGRFEIVVKWRNPWWYPPASDWAKDAKPIPPGPGNPLGTRWMGISSPAVGIHGTPDSSSIGYSLSHGCIRMLIPQVEWLFNQVEIGTPVYIVAS